MRTPLALKLLGVMQEERLRCWMEFWCIMQGPDVTPLCLLLAPHLTQLVNIAKKQAAVG